MSSDRPARPPSRGRADDRRLPTELITLLAVGAWVVLGCGFMSAITIHLIHISNYVIGLSYVPALYLSTLALRACWLTGPRVRRAWRNLILMVVLSVIGVGLVQATREHHRRFWQQVLPDLARALR